MLGAPFRCDRQSDAHAHSLTERTGGQFNAGGVPIFGMAGAFAVQLAKAFDVIEPHRRPTRGVAIRIDFAHLRKEERRIEEHGGVARGKHEPVAGRPEGILRIVTKMPLP